MLLLLQNLNPLTKRSIGSRIKAKHFILLIEYHKLSVKCPWGCFILKFVCKYSKLLNWFLKSMPPVLGIWIKPSKKVYNRENNKGYEG